GLGCTGSHEPIVSGQIGAAGGSPGFPATGGTPGFVSGTGGALVLDPIMCSNTGGATFTGSGGVSGRGRTQFPPSLGTTYSQPAAPPAITGGTLLVLADGKTAVAADPDRDAIYVVDLPSRTVTQTISLEPGDEPGRLVQDAAGRVHVALRHGGAIATCDPTTGKVLARRAICAAPRGLAYEAATDRVHVACHDGQLISLPAAGGDPVRRLQLDDDLRDVLVDGDTLLVTRFRSAELLTVAADGTVTGRVQPPAFTSPAAHNDALYTASVAWRALPAPGGGTLVLHQRGMVDPVVPTAGGYGGPSPCDAIVHHCITRIDRDGTTHSGPALASLVLAVDMAVSPDGKQVAVVSAGNATNVDVAGVAGAPALTRVFLTDLDDVTDPQIGCSMDGKHAPCAPTVGIPIAISTGSAGATGTRGLGGSVGTGMGGAPGTGGLTGTGSAIGAGGRAGVTCSPTTPGVPDAVGQPVAVAFDGSGGLVVQSREPAMLSLGDGTTITLSTVSRADTGHTLFHANSGGFLACASCHAEGNEDGRTWNFACEGSRRTQSLQTGLAGSEPFHWDGNETDFSHLMTDVFQGRMSGPALATDQGAALLSWLDSQPRAPKPQPADAAAVAHGQALFQDPAHGCAICHAGSHMTNNQTVDVGTGGRFQVPSLLGVGSRAPYMHNGCAPTLADRFGPCGGGDQHGVTSTLSPADVSDLVAYLKTL
ncbi:MAG TPA: c-type cytochrome, partial [Polyangia bacterium]|nr:c-type cytochrome [Polyangia bacterium]